MSVQTGMLTPPLSSDELTLYEELKVAPNEVCVSESDLIFERKMGDTELSYFLPSRQTGVNDMYARVLARCVPAKVRCETHPARAQVFASRLRRPGAPREPPASPGSVGPPASAAPTPRRGCADARL